MVCDSCIHSPEHRDRANIPRLRGFEGCIFCKSHRARRDSNPNFSQVKLVRSSPVASCLGSSLPGRKLSRLAPTNVGTLCAFLTSREKCGLMPSLTSSSFAILSSPHSKLSRDISRIKRRSSAGIGGRPGFDFQCQRSRNPARCQRINVFGWTTTSASRQLNNLESKANVMRVAGSIRRGSPCALGTVRAADVERDSQRRSPFSAG